jgi:hypothetical protein
VIGKAFDNASILARRDEDRACRPCRRPARHSCGHVGKKFRQWPPR